MQNWDDIRYFLAVCRNKSYLKASESLLVNASTVARRIEQLEEKINARLFDKHRHGMIPTPMGLRLLDQAYEMERTVLSMHDILAQNDLSQSGEVVLSLTDGLGSAWLTPNLSSFYSSCPNITLKLKMEMKTADLALREADIAIRTHRPTENPLIAKHVGTVRFHVFAAPSYLDRMGAPKSWADLSSHKIVDYEGYAKSKALKLWQETVNNHDRVILSTNSAQSYVRALQNGLGLGMLPRFYRHAVTDLVTLDLDTELFEMPIYVVTHEQVKHVKRIQMVKDHLIYLFERDRNSWFS